MRPHPAAQGPQRSRQRRRPAAGAWVVWLPPGPAESPAKGLEYRQPVAAKGLECRRPVAAKALEYRWPAAECVLAHEAPVLEVAHAIWAELEPAAAAPPAKLSRHAPAVSNQAAPLPSPLEVRHSLRICPLVPPLPQARPQTSAHVRPGQWLTETQPRRRSAELRSPGASKARVRLPVAEVRRESRDPAHHGRAVRGNLRASRGARSRTAFAWVT